jgi:hypothetical protein
VLIPLARNDGSRVRADEMQRILANIMTRFGGYSLGTPIRGAWTDATGHRFDDDTQPVIVSCDRERLEEAKQLVIAIGRQLGQKAMWFEVQYYDGVQILDCE